MLTTLIRIDGIIHTHIRAFYLINNGFRKYRQVLRLRSLFIKFINSSLSVPVHIHASETYFSTAFAPLSLYTLTIIISNTKNNRLKLILHYKIEISHIFLCNRISKKNWNDVLFTPWRRGREEYNSFRPHSSLDDLTPKRMHNTSKKQVDSST